MGAELVRTILHFWPELRQWLKDFPDPRRQELITYERSFLACWALSLFLFKLRSRRQLDYELDARDTSILDNLNRLAGTKQKTRPVHKTMNNYLSRIGLLPWLKLQRQIVQRLLRAKVLEAARLQGRYVMPVDATGQFAFRERHCPGCLEQQHGDTKVYLHQMLDAKLLGPCGLVIPIGNEPIQNSDAADSAAGAGAEERKQDCELKAFDRLAVNLKKEYPQLRLCVSGDSLYACGRLFNICQQNRWSYVLTFKEGRMPSVWQEFQALLKLCPQNCVQRKLADDTRQVFRWVNDVSYRDSEGRDWTFHILQCEETDPDGTKHRFVWITDLEVNERKVIDIAEKGGRPRWHIENQGFNMQKNSDLNLEHAYSLRPTLMQVYYVLLQIAHLMLQLLEKGSLLKRLAASVQRAPLQLFGSLKNIARRLLESFRHYRIADAVYDVMAAARIQIRFDSS